MKELAFRSSIAASPAFVFAALTDAKALEIWLDEHADVSLNDGRFDFWGRYSLEGERGRKRLIGSESDRKLSFTWLLGGEVTTVEIALEPTDDGATRITLSHRDMAERDGAEPFAADFWRISIDNLANYCEGRLITARCDVTSIETGRSTAEVEIDASPEEVFASLVVPEQLNRWVGGESSVEPRIGGRYDFGWDHGPIKILDLEPPKTLSYSWNYAETGETVVRWELEGSGGKTRLTLVHSGFTDKKTSGGYKLGWQAFLVSLRRMHEVGPSWRRIEWVTPAE